MSKQKNKIIVLMVEGDTEICFYKALIRTIREKNRETSPFQIEYLNMKGIGNYKNDALRRFNRLKLKNPESIFEIMLCYDTDVFDLSKKPPVNMNSVKKELLQAGAQRVEHIRASKSIEDWFLIDWAGVLKYLHLHNRLKKHQVMDKRFSRIYFSKAIAYIPKGQTTRNLLAHWTSR